MADLDDLHARYAAAVAAERETWSAVKRLSAGTDEYEATYALWRVAVERVTELGKELLANGPTGTSGP